jgi:hypothetical protein
MAPRLLAIAFICLPALLHAQATRTWVSGVGDDANPCSRTAPCKTFAGAISKTAAGGIIDVLDPGGFGAVTITKAITIEGNADEGSVLVAGTNGIVVSAASTDVVTLRKLNFEGVGSGLTAIKINSAGAVHIESCTINGFTQNGINYGASNTPAELFIKGTSIHKCALAGIQLGTTAATAVHIADSHISDCLGGGISVGANVTVVVNKTVCEGNSVAGFMTTAATSKLYLVGCTATGNAVGIDSTAGTITIAECSVLNNVGAGLKNSTGAKIESFSTNAVHGNTPDGASTQTLTQK